jgi:hypothetical protein
MFLHIENQKMLWTAIQRCPHFLEFSVGNREIWFRDTVSRFYRENPVQPISKNDLLAVNKAVLQYLMRDLKSRMEYEQKIDVPAQITYSVEEDRKAKEERANQAYENYQNQYHMLLQTPKPVVMRLTEKSDEKIKNMDELIQQQIKQREMDLASFAKASPKIKILEPDPAISQEIAAIIQEASVDEKSVTWAPTVEEYTLTSGHMGKNPYDQRICLDVFSVAHGQH